MRKNLKPKLWGRNAWKFLHDVVDGSDSSSRNECIKLIELLPFILPCAICRKHTMEYIKLHPPRNEFDLRLWLITFEKDIIKRKSAELHSSRNSYFRIFLILLVVLLILHISP